MNIKKLSIIILLIAFLRADGESIKPVEETPAQEQGENQNAEVVNADPEVEKVEVAETPLATPAEIKNEEQVNPDPVVITNTLELQVTKTWWFLIFRHVNFYFNLKSTVNEVVTNKSWVASIWYFWSSYFEKFTQKTYKLKITNVVNTKALESVEIELQADKDGKWTAKNYGIPDECKNSAKVDVKIVDKSWKELTKEYHVEYTCPAKVDLKVAEKIVL